MNVKFGIVPSQDMVGLGIVPYAGKSPVDIHFGFLSWYGLVCTSSEQNGLAIDEFQQIAEYPEKGVEALLRSHIQFMSQVNFIFPGSKQHIMREMFMMALSFGIFSNRGFSITKLPISSVLK